MLFTFPSRYWSTIGLTGVFSLAGWSRRIHAGFLVPRATQDYTRREASSRTGLSPSTAGLSRPVLLVAPSCHVVVLLPRACLDTRGLGWSPFARHYLGNHCCFLFLQVLRCFSSLRLLNLAIVYGLQPYGFPHSDIPGSIPVCKSPGLFAAYHVLPRFRKPRHPPFALLLFLVLFW